MTPLEIESTFAAIGLEAILAGKPKLGKGTLETAADAPKDHRRRILRFLASDAWLQSEELPKLDYEATLKLVSFARPRQDGVIERLTPEQSQAVVAAVPDHELATDICGMTEQILAWANTTIPRGEPDPLTNQVTEDPPEGMLLDFRRVWLVVCRPISVLEDLASGDLFDDQVATLAQFFPATFADMKQAALEGVATMVSRRGKSWKPDSTKSAFLDTLLQRSLLDPALTAAMQQVTAAEQAQQGGKGPKLPKPGKDNTEATPGQKAAEG
jgi:hypothetical protein